MSRFLPQSHNLQVRSSLSVKPNDKPRSLSALPLDGASHLVRQHCHQLQPERLHFTQVESRWKANTIVMNAKRTSRFVFPVE